MLTLRPPKCDIKAISANVRGLNRGYDPLNTLFMDSTLTQPNPTPGNSKFHKLISIFNQSTYNILAIQEHKLKTQDEKDHKSYLDYFPNISSLISYNDEGTAAGGTALLIKHDTLGITPNSIHWSTGLNGRVTTAQFTKDEEGMHFASIYAPHDPTERVQFFQDLFLSDLISEDSLSGGDFNCVPNIHLDTSSSTKLPYPNKGAQQLEAGMANLGLTDILRTHAGKKGKPIFTRLSDTRNS